MNSKVITDYYENLGYGKKDPFVREVAEALDRSSSSVRQKLKDGNWTKIEIKEIESIITGN